MGGAFALCILDLEAGRALLAADRCGSHPLAYLCQPQGLLFGTSLAALAALPDGPRELDRQALYDYLHFHVIPAPRTVYRGVRRLLPGEYLLYQGGRAQCGSYWEAGFEESGAVPFEALQERFLAAVEDSVQDAIAGGGAGAFLSGGTDSSTIAGLLGLLSGEAPRTYSIGFDVPGYDELDYANLVARHYRAEHHELYLTPDDVLAAIPRIASAYDQPFGNASAVPAYYCARMAQADGVTRLLGGDGGDELFGGNQRYATQARLERYQRLPPALRQLLLEPLLFGLEGRLDTAPLRKARSYVRQALMDMPARLDSYNLLRSYGASRVLAPEFLEQVDSSAPQSLMSALYWQAPALSIVNRMQALDLRLTLADNDLVKVSKACELAGVETAFPLLGDAVLAFSLQLAPRHKLDGTRLRPFFKQAMRGRLPGAVLRKRKHGFGLPVGPWLVSHAGLRRLAEDSLGSLKQRGIVRAGFIDELLGRRLAEHPPYHGTMVWVLMMLEQWLQQQGQPVSIAGSGSAAQQVVHQS
ncbi:asparagine synthetase B family protein [Oxalobacteraceae bacterium A2-2]